MTPSGAEQSEHVCALTLLLEGEAVCLECGAYYIYQSTLTEPELVEVREEADRG